MKRILEVSPFPPFIGGVSVSVKRLCDHLVSLGYQPVKFDTQLSNKKINWKILKFLKYLSLPVYLMFHKRFDIIHFHVSNFLPKFYVSLWRPLFSKKTKFILTIHGSITGRMKSHRGYFAMRGFDTIICVREGDSVNVPEKLRYRAVEIPAFIPPAESKPSVSKNVEGAIESFVQRRTFKILVNGFVIINERYNDLYGFGDAVELGVRMNESGRDTGMILIVLGLHQPKESRQFTDRLKGYIREKNLEDHFMWIESSPMDMWPLLKRVNLLLRPTKTDGDALSIREALFLKTPVITSDAVPRPAGTITYKRDSSDDLFAKTVDLFENYNEIISGLNNYTSNFADKILEQYDIG
ncbi:MAG TPA: hypothetical protein VK155_04585 [Bacteroidales bacterium]|jgi:glycosyltransferase involved in cell wall biosynthesis|nr:hypothetical protein [Bacteroidales bacterium]